MTKFEFKRFSGRIWELLSVMSFKFTILKLFKTLLGGFSLVGKGCFYWQNIWEPVLRPTQDQIFLKIMVYFFYQNPKIRNLKHKNPLKQNLTVCTSQKRRILGYFWLIASFAKPKGIPTLLKPPKHFSDTPTAIGSPYLEVEDTINLNLGLCPGHQVV